MIRRHGIGARLLLAFMLIAGLGLSASAVGWLMLRDVARTQEAVTTQALPAVARAQAVARMSAQMVAAVPVLTGASTQDQRTWRARSLFGDAADLRTVLGELQSAPVDPEVVGRLEEKADTLIANLQRQNGLVAQRLRLTETTNRAAERAASAATSIADLSAGLTANANARATAVIAGLYDLLESPANRQRAARALDRLAEVDLYLMERMFALRLRSSQIAILMSQVRSAPTQTEIDSVREQFGQHLRVLRRRVESIRDPVRRGQAGNHLRDLSKIATADGDADVFELRRRVVDTQTRIEDLSAANRRLSGELDRLAVHLVSQARSYSERAAQDARHAASYGLWTIVAVSTGSLLLASLIVWFYVERGVARRLDNLSGAMRALAGGDLDVRVPPHGRDELADMARAINVFRDDAVRRRKLESERDAVERELRQHREELQRQVAERTAQLTEANENLKHEVTEHQQARAEAERASRAKSEFLATVSHEIRTPMSGMLGMLRVLNDSDEPPLAQRRRLALVDSSAQTLLSILNGILDYSKAEAGQIEIDEDDFDVCELLDRLVALVRPSAEQKGLVLRSECSTDIPRWLRGDAAKLRQVLFNLVGNAIKFTDVGEVLLRVRTDSEAQDGEVRLHFAVSDTGVGLEGDDCEAIFQPFHQVNDDRRRREGTGLGLAIAQRLTEAMGGGIGVDSVPGRGSRFAFTLAFRRGRPRAQGKGGMEAIPQGERVGRKRVLVVEDDDVHRLVVSTFLEQLGHVVDDVATGEDAIERAEATLPDVVLMDISLPGIDGLTAARRLRERAGANVPVVAMSAHVFRNEIESYREAGMDAVIIKPVWPETLNAGLAEAFRDGPTKVLGAVPALEGPAGDEPPSVLDPSELAADENALGTAAARRVVDVFLATAGDRVARFDRAARARDCRNAAHAAHELKSAAQSLALHALAEACAVAERAAIDEEASRLPALAERLEAAHREATAALQAQRALRPENA